MQDAISDAEIPRLHVQLLKDELACPTRQPRQEHHRYLGFPKALCKRTTECRINRKPIKHAEAFSARRKAR